MTINDLEKIHKETLNLLFKANEKIKDSKNKLWYNGQFYSGSLNPEILFVGYNPGYGDEWHKRQMDSDIVNKEFQLSDIKYIEEKQENKRLASQIYFLLDNIVDNPEKYLNEKVAETNFIHFNTPNIETYNKSIKNLDEDLKIKIKTHFINSLNEIIKLVKPKVLVIIGSRTFDELNRELNFNEIEILEKNTKGERVCTRAILKYTNEIKVIATMHLSTPGISDSNIGSIGSYIKDIIRT